MHPHENTNDYLYGGFGPLFDWARENTAPDSPRYCEQWAPRRPLGSTKKLWKASYKGYKPAPVPRFPKVKPYNWRAEIAARKAAHTRACGAPQCFPLYGDGHKTVGARRSVYYTDIEKASALSRARYLDWLDARRHARESMSA